LLLSLGFNLEGSPLDTADAVAVFVDGDPHVALLAPSGAPGVSNKVVILAIGSSAVSNHGDDVVDLPTAGLVVQDASLVSLEDVVDVDSAGDHTLAESRLVLADRHVQLFPILNLDFAKSFLGMVAGAHLLGMEPIARVVWVLLGRDQALVFQVLENACGPSTLAFVVWWRVAGYELLL
jgi:hypothetical protein